MLKKKPEQASKVKQESETSVPASSSNILNPAELNDESSMDRVDSPRNLEFESPTNGSSLSSSLNKQTSVTLLRNESELDFINCTDVGSGNGGIGILFLMLND